LDIESKTIGPFHTCRRVCSDDQRVPRRASATIAKQAGPIFDQSVLIEIAGRQICATQTRFELTTFILQQGSRIVIAGHLICAPLNGIRPINPSAIKRKRDCDVVFTVSFWEDLVIDLAGNVSRSGDLRNQPSAFHRQGVGGGVQHIPRGANEGVHGKFRTS
jgi:hypothetical protein